MFLFNMWEQPFGVRVEHSHRLYGAAVGLFTLVLAGWLLVFEPRKWLKWLGVAGGGDGDCSGCAGGHAGHADLDDSGGRSRVCGPGVFRAHCRPVRLHRPPVAEAGWNAD